MSSAVKFVDASDNVNVNIEVSPQHNEVELAAIETSGAVVSTLCEELAATAT
jgi:hypothetical protein